MSRNAQRHGDIHIIRGSDHAVGRFVQVADGRFAGSDKDEQGEGYVMDWDSLFGFSVNLIGATVDDLYNDTKLRKLSDIYAKTL